MKKKILILVITAVSLIAFSSCGSSKHTCPAYSSVQVANSQVVAP